MVKLEKKATRIGKDQLITDVANSTNVTKADVKRIIDATIAEISVSMKKGREVSIKNFGTFKTVKVAKKKGRNIQTGEPITIPAHKKVKFTPGKALTDMVTPKK